VPALFAPVRGAGAEHAPEARAGDLPGAEAMCDRAQALATAWSPEDAARAASVREDCHTRREARAAPDAAANAAARADAMRRRLALADDVPGAARQADDPQAREALALAARPPDELSSMVRPG